MKLKYKWLDPDLAADAGEEVWDVLKSLRDATGETDPHRQAKLVQALQQAEFP